MAENRSGINPEFRAVSGRSLPITATDLYSGNRPKSPKDRTSPNRRRKGEVAGKNSLVLTVSNGPVALKSNGCGDYDLPLRASGKTHYDPSRNQCEEDKRIRNVLRLPQGTSTTRFARCSTSSSCVSTSFSSDFGS